MGFGGGIGQVWGPTDEREAIRSVHRALDLGVIGRGADGISLDADPHSNTGISAEPIHNGSDEAGRMVSGRRSSRVGGNSQA